MDARILLKCYRIRLDTGCDVGCSFCDSWHSRPVAVGAHGLCTGIVVAKRLGAETIAISGGEPLISPVLSSMLTALRETGLPTHITTNGELLAEKVAELAANGVSSIHVSVEQLHGNTRLKSKKPVSFDRVREGIDSARRENLHIEINYLVLRGHNDDYGHIKQVLDFCDSIGADLNLLDLLYGWNTALAPLCVPYCEIRRVLEEQVSLTGALVERSGTMQTRYMYRGIKVHLRDFRAIPDRGICSECADDPSTLGLTPMQLSTSGTVGICRHHRINVEDSEGSISHAMVQLSHCLTQQHKVKWNRT